MKILITGMCGFVGTALVKTWRERGANHVFIGMDNLSRPGSEINFQAWREAGVCVVHGDTRNPSDFDALSDVDYVIDAAANPSVLAGVDGRSSSRQLVEHNLMGTLNVLEFCRVRRAGLILLSTSRVYSIAPLASLPLAVKDGAFVIAPRARLPVGVSPRGVSEEFSTAAPVSLYGATKVASEVMALEYAEAFGILVWINRCGVLAGAGQLGHAEQGIFSYWIHAWAQRRPLRYLGFEGNGHQVRDGLHPRELVSVLDQQMAFTDKPTHRVFNFAGGPANAMSLHNLSAWCKQRFGEHKVASDPTPRAYDIPWLALDCERAGQTWGWQPAVSLPAILEEIAQFAERNPRWLDLCAPTGKAAGPQRDRSRA